MGTVTKLRQPRQPLTSDIGRAIFDKIEDRAFALYDDNGRVNGTDHIEVVDVSDFDNLFVFTHSGARFRVSVIREG